MNPPSSALLICPSDRPPLAFLGQARPLALVPALGRTLIDLWLTDLAARGFQNVLILAADRPEQLRRDVGNGERWGIQVRVIPESRELTPDEALSKFPSSAGKPPPLVAVADRLPGASEPFASPAHWFESIRARIPDAAAQRVGFRAFAPGIWIHARARVSPAARLEAPCWIGANVWVGPHAHFGPGSIAEDDAYIDEGAEVTHSFIGPATYVGAMTHLDRSLAWGRSLCKWTSGSVTEVHDDFLLGELGRATRPAHRTSWVARLLALATLALLSPVVVVAALRRRPAGTPLFLPREAVRTPITEGSPIRTFRYFELQGVSGLWRRYPELWNIARGDFHWVGNRPLSRAQVAELDSEFDRLWLSVPTGSISLADAEQCRDLLGDEGRAHASFYAVRRGLRINLDILRRALAHPHR